MAFAIDRTLLRRAVDGETSALNSLVSELRPHIERQLLRYPVADEDRRDLLQATLMQVIRRLGSFRGDSSFSTWLFRVTANEALMMMRSQRRHRSRLVEGLDLEELGSLPASNDGELTHRGDVGAANSERDSRVRTALDELPEDYRNVVVAHYHMDLGLQEIADRFELSESAVRSRLHRARSRLRAMLEGTPLASEAREEAARARRNARQARAPRAVPAVASAMASEMAELTISDSVAPISGVVETGSAAEAIVAMEAMVKDAAEAAVTAAAPESQPVVADGEVVTSAALDDAA
jgi:RNA polymerase sigma-70 factor (ECF subfamily)